MLWAFEKCLSLFASMKNEKALGNLVKKKYKKTGNGNKGYIVFILPGKVNEC
jgi:hypothetical protein